MQAPEIEVKFPVADVAELQARLPGFGFRLVTPRTFESNTLYDTPAHALRETHQILRVRQYGEQWTVTHKRHPDASEAATETPYKIRIETETTVADGPALAEIFTRLGYGPSFRYEKFRTEWARGMAHLVIDETPIGIFAELEGPPEEIDEALAQLEIDQTHCITDSYGRLFVAWKQRTGSPAENLTFAEIPAAG